MHDDLNAADALELAMLDNPHLADTIAQIVEAYEQNTKPAGDEHSKLWGDAMDADAVGRKPQKKTEQTP